MFKHILVCTDGSEAAMRAIDTACALAGICDARLTLLHVPHAETVAFALGAVAGYHAAMTMPPPEEVTRAADSIIAQATARCEAAGVTPVEALVRRGETTTEVLAAARDGGVDLIVTGRRGLGNLGALVLGSTSAAITHHAECAVLTVP